MCLAPRPGHVERWIRTRQRTSTLRRMTMARAGRVGTLLESSVVDVQAISCAGSGCTLIATDGHAGAPLVAETTTNAGSSWTSSTIVTRTSIGEYVYFPAVGLSCPAQALCYAAGQTGSEFEGIVDKHSGTAKTWSQLSATTGPQPLASLACPTKLLCVAVGGDGALRSTNGGVTWAVSTQGIATTVSLASVACPSATTCLAIGDAAGKPVEYRSTDAAHSWHTVHLPTQMSGVSAISCSGSAYCVVIGAAAKGVLESTTLGASWVYRAFPSIWGTPQLSAVSCAGGSCVAVGTLVEQDTDIAIRVSGGGSTLTFLTDGSFYDPSSINCTSASTCWADGVASFGGPGTENPGVYETTDGGATWVPAGQPDIAGTQRWLSARRSCVTLSAPRGPPHHSGTNS